jgi:hypothetical protein
VEACYSVSTFGQNFCTKSRKKITEKIENKTITVENSGSSSIE